MRDVNKLAILEGKVESLVRQLEVYFYALRFGSNHEGMGDIRLTIGQQEEIIEAVKDVTSTQATLNNGRLQANDKPSNAIQGSLVPDSLEDAIWLVAEIIEQYEDKPPGPDDPPFEFQPEWVRNSYYRRAKTAIVGAANITDDIGEKYHKVGRKR